MRKKSFFMLLIALALVVCLQPVTAYAAGNTISVGGTIEVPVTAESGVIYYFTAPESATYVIYEDVNEKTSVDIAVYENEDNWVDSGNSRIQFDAEAGKTYALHIYIYSMDGDMNAKSKIHLVKPGQLTSIKLEKSSVVGYVGGFTWFEFDIAPLSGLVDGEWSSSNPAVVEINGWRGSTEASMNYNAPGTATITYKNSNGVKASATVTVREPKTINEGSAVNVSVAPGDAVGFTFTATKDSYYWFERSYTDGNEYTQKLELMVCGDGYNSNTDSLSASSTGGARNDYGCRKGNTYLVTLTNDTNTTYNGTLSVNQAVPATSITIVDAPKVIYLDSYYWINAEFGPEYAIPENATWTSSNPEVLRINDQWNTNCGLEALAEGKSTITVTSESGLTHSVEISVEEYNYTYEGDPLVLNQPNKVVINGPEDFACYEYTPAVSGYYYFEHDADKDADIGVFKENNDSDGTGFYGNNVGGFAYWLEAGENYIVYSYYHDVTVVGSYNLYVSKMGSKSYGWYKHGEDWFFFENSKLVSGWKKLDGKWYYFKQSYAMATEWREVDGVQYYFGTDGVMKTGWQKVDGKWYYMDPSGAMQTGWTKVSGKWYYLGTDGAMKTGWQKIDGKWYYLNTEMKTGWQKIDGKWYYLNTEMKTGWLKQSGKWYYLDASGAMQTGWEKVGGKWYYLNASGVMQTRWQKIDGKWYYLGADGAMQTGWVKLDGKWYYLNTSGVMVTGTQTIDGKAYKFDANGVWIK